MAVLVSPADAQTFVQQKALSRWFVYFRVMFSCTLIGAMLVFRPDDQSSFYGQTFSVMLSLVLIHLTMGLFFLLLQDKVRDRKIWLFTVFQIIWDLTFDTILVYFTGGISSQFRFVYWLTIIFASSLFQWGGYFASAFSGLFFAVLANIQFSGQLPQVPIHQIHYQTWTIEQLSRSILLTALSFFGVAYVSKRLMDRLREAQKALLSKAEQVEDLENLMSRIVNSIGSGLATVDRYGAIRFWNKAATDILGIPSDQVVGQQLTKFLPIDAAELNVDVADSGSSRPELEVISQGEDQSEKVIGYTLNDLRQYGRGEASEKLIVFQDLTAYRRLEKKVNHAERLAYLGEFAAKMAHEIRNPLASMSGAVQILKDAKGDKSTDPRLMDIVLRETDRLNLLLTELLDFTRPVRKSFSVFDVSGLLEDVAALFHQSIREKPIGFDVNVEPDLMLEGDQSQIRQVIWNLLKNAADAVGSDGKIILMAMKGPFQEVLVEVSDDGEGMDPETENKIFEPFFTTKTKGTGMGLSVVHRLVEENGGSIRSESKKGFGSTFTLIFEKSSQK